MSNRPGNDTVYRTATSSEMRQAAADACHPIPKISLPDGWERNEPMCDDDRTDIGLRNDNFDRFIEIHAVDPLTQVEGPYYLDAMIRHGGPESFETRPVERVTGVEPGEIQEAVIELTLILKNEEEVKHVH